jgi:hypothetical protein
MFLVIRRVDLAALFHGSWRHELDAGTSLAAAKKELLRERGRYPKGLAFPVNEDV